MRDLTASPELIERDIDLPELRMPRRTAASALAVCAGYYLATKVGFALTFPNYAASALWPTNAFLLAALLLAPRRTWGVLLLAAFPAHLTAQLGSGVPLQMVLCWFLSNCAEALLGAALIRRTTGGTPRFDRSRDVTAFVSWVTFATVTTSFLDAGLVALVGWGTQGYWEELRMRCFSNLLAAVTLIPAIVAAAGIRVAALRRCTPRQAAEAGAFAVGLLVVDLVPFASPSGQQGLTPVLVYAPLPLLFWASVRLGPSAVSLSLLATALLAIGGAMRGLGPFTTMSPPENVLSLQVFLITMTVPLLFLAAVVRERRETERALRASLDRLARTEAFSSVMVTHVGLDGRWLRVPQTLCDLLGFSEDEVLAMRITDVTHPDDVEATGTRYERLLGGEIQSFDLEAHLVCRGGHALWVDLNGSLVAEADGKPLHYLTYIKDITERKRVDETLRARNERIRDLAARLITAQEEERRRIARELHDDLNQHVAAVAIGLSALKRQVGEAPDPVRDQVVLLQGRVSDIADRVRAISHQLHSSALEHVGLPAALASLCEEFRDQQGIDVALETRGNLTAVPADAVLCLYRVAQESLRNIARHSGAGRAEVLLVGDGDSVRLAVRDRGVGFDYARARHSGGIGLVGMEERVRSLGGSFRVTGGPGLGTELVAEVPMEKATYG